ncbi:MAG: hypothetical protein AAGA29_10915 [Planctomycetota bacterium]
MSDAPPSSPTTLGQRIDALLGPLETEAHQYREAIELGRQQVRQLQDKVAQAEQALADIEQQMGRVLDTLTQQEPLLAGAMGRVTQVARAEQASSAAPVANASASPAPQPGPELAAASPQAADNDATPDDHGPLAGASDAPLPQAEAMPDAQAIDEISDLLNAPLGQAQGMSTGAEGPLADAAAQAEQAAERLGDSLQGGDAGA